MLSRLHGLQFVQTVLVEKRTKNIRLFIIVNKSKFHIEHRSHENTINIRRYWPCRLQECKTFLILMYFLVFFQTLIETVMNPHLDRKYTANILASRHLSGSGSHSRRNYDFEVEIPSDAAINNFSSCSLFQQKYTLLVSHFRLCKLISRYSRGEEGSFAQWQL